MKTDRIWQLIKTKQIKSSADISALDSLLLKHPYFQAGQLLLAKGLLNTNSIRYNQQLKKAAAYCAERRNLFNLITSVEKEQETTDFLNKLKPKSTEEELKLKEPLKFNQNEAHSFSEWLTVLNIKKIHRENDTTIEKFLKNKAPTSRPKKEAFFKPINVAKESLIENTNLITPTLAKVYLEQEHYEKAITAYEKLILKYPKKSGFFASQIKLIRKLNTK